MAKRGFFWDERRYMASSALVTWLFRSKRRAQTVHPTSILVIKMDEIGDMVLSTFVYEQLKRDFPAATVTVLCKPFARPIIENNPYVDHIITHVDEWTQRYDVVIELRGNWQTLRKTLKLWPKVRLEIGTLRISYKLAGVHPHEMVTQSRIIEPLLRSECIMQPKLFPTEAARNDVSDFLSSRDIQSYAVLAPGARSPLRRWPPDRLAAVAQWLFESRGLRCICAGGPDDRDSINSIVSASNGAAVATPENWSLTTFIALCEGASLFIGNDSGPLHIASTFNIPVVGIYGPVAPGLSYPINSRSTYIHHVLPCNPCDQVHCVQPENPCIRLVQVNEVMKAVEEVLGTRY